VIIQQENRAARNPADHMADGHECAAVAGQDGCYEDLDRKPPDYRLTEHQYQPISAKTKLDSLDYNSTC